MDEYTKPKKLNADPREYLFCEECEVFLSENYEKYGTRLLKESLKTIETKESIIYNNFKYKTFYLYLISILWRASISILEDFKSVNSLPENLNEYFRRTVLNNSVKIDAQMRMDDFIKISALRIIDKSLSIPQKTINRVFININGEKGKTPQEGMIFYFLIDGYLINYYLHPIISIQKLDQYG